MLKQLFGFRQLSLRHENAPEVALDCGGIPSTAELEKHLSGPAIEFFRLLQAALALIDKAHLVQSCRHSSLVPQCLIGGQHLTVQVEGLVEPSLGPFDV